MRTILLYLSCICILFFAGCEKKSASITETEFFFDTVIQITLYDNAKQSLIEDCFKMAKNYEEMFSRTLEGSDFYAINHSQGTPVTVSEETISLIETAFSYYRLSEGAFDISLGTLSDLWNIKENTGILPAKTDIQKALSESGLEYLSVSGNRVTLHSSATLDAGAIAKGFVADKMKAYLNQKGVTQGIINLGGNIITLGSKQDNKPYIIGIQQPFATDGSPALTLSLTEGSVVTSGVYQRYVELDGKIYHHVLDPATGYPSDNHLWSVTILSEHSVDGDALSTTCLVLGLEKGMQLIESLNNTEAIFITDEEQIYTTSGIKDDIQIISKP